jgi:hypothetical protein
MAQKCIPKGMPQMKTINFEKSQKNEFKKQKKNPKNQQKKFK